MRRINKFFVIMNAVYSFIVRMVVMNYRIIGATLSALTLLQGCANSAITGIPDAQPFDAVALEKPRSMQHWKSIAAENVRYFMQAIPFDVDYGLKLGVYIERPTQPTEFEQAYADLLATQLTAQGIPVLSEKRPEALVLTYQTQLLHYDSRTGYRPYEATSALTAGAVVAGLTTISPPAAVLGASMASVAAGETALSSAQAHNYTQYETRLSVMVNKADWLMSAWSKILSVHDDEAMIYAKPTMPIDNRQKRVDIHG